MSKNNTYQLNFAVLSDRGLVRSNNEDSAYAGPHLLILADGMGGHAAGEVASQIMVNRLSRLDADPEDNDMLALLGGMADDANVEIADYVREHPETDGMGCTTTALMFDGRRFGMLHVGDSRGYRLRDGKLEQITVDDTYVQSLVEQGKLDPEDVSSHPQKSLILKAYTGRTVDPTLQMLDARPGDRMLLCSDGLSDPVHPSTIEQALGTGSPIEAATRLVELALRSGGPDNVTVVVADVVDVDELSPKQRRALSSSPAVAGALLVDAAEATHLDTAAGRAAALAARQPREVLPAENPAQPPTAKEAKGRSPLLGIVIALVMVIALIGGGWWAWGAKDDHYFVSTASSQGVEDRIIIERGVNFSFFGKDLHHPYQVMCLGPKNELRFEGVDQREASKDECSPFTLKDLPESVRTQVDGLDSGSYSDVTQQLTRLAAEALPVCLTPENSSANTPEGQRDKSSNNEGSNNEKGTGGDLRRPGINCREVL